MKKQKSKSANLPTPAPADAALSTDKVANRQGSKTSLPEDGIGSRLREAREGLALSQHGMHTRSKMVDPEGVGISRAVLSLYETGKNKPGAREIRILCEVLKITPNWLIFGRDNPARTLQASLSFLRGSELALAPRVAIALLALDPEERDSVASIVFSLVTKKLGDIGLSSLMMMASLVQVDLTAKIRKELGEDADKLPVEEALKKFVDRWSDATYSNYGTLRPNISVEEFEEIGPDKPPPPPRKLSQST